MFENFSKMKDLYELKKKADILKKEMEKITTEVFEGKYKIVVRGDQTIESISENGEENNDLKKAINKAIKESQKQVAKKMRGQMSDLGLPDI